MQVPGVDLGVLADWLRSHGLGDGSVDDPRLITGGTQNVLLRFTWCGRDLVLRRPPVHKRPNSDETMRREARVLGALAGSGVPHPALVLSEPDPDVLGASFYLMEPVEGFNPSLGLPLAFAGAPAMQREMGLAMADAIAALAAVDHVAVGLGDLGKPDQWARRQVGRWRSQLDGYSALDGYPGPDIPGVDEVGSWLEQHVPVDSRPGLMHGDFHFANVLIAHDRPVVAAIVDWELVTVGDPLLDLGHLLATWPERSATVGVSVDAPSLPTRAEVVERYAARSTRPLDDLRWFHVLACYRLGLILEGTHARACAGLAPLEIGDQLHAHTVALLQQALELVG